MVGCWCAAGGQGTAWALSRRERVPAPRAIPRESPRPGGTGSHCLPGFLHGAWSCSSGPRFTACECPLGTPRTGGRRFLHREGGSSSGGLRSRRSHSLSLVLQHSREGQWRWVKVSRLGAGRGSFSQSRLQATQAGRRPDFPRVNPSVGVGHARLDPLHLAQYRVRHPVSAPGPYFFPGTLPLRVWERSWEVWSTGNGAVLCVAGRSSRSTDTTPGTL